MAGWISSKLKVAENLLQQIDQQAAESLRKNEHPSLSPDRRDHDDEAPTGVASSPLAVPLKLQISKKPTPQPIRLRDRPRRDGEPAGDAQAGRAPSKALVEVEDDWTELLATAPARTRPGGVALERQRSGRRLGVAERRSNASAGGWTSRKLSSLRSDAEESGKGGVKNRAESGAGGDGGRNSDDVVSGDGVGEAERVSEVGSVDVDVAGGGGSGMTAARGGNEASSEIVDLKGEMDDDGGGGGGGEVRKSEEMYRSSTTVGSSAPYGESESSEGSDSESESELLSSDSEKERESREERRRRRERMIAEKKAAMAVEAIKEHENIVARLEGEKQSLEKILEERKKQQVEEALELQTSMMETMEAVELEKQKHNSTRMEALARLAALESTNADLAKSLASAQWNLEIEVNRVVDLQQQIEFKKVAQKDLKGKIGKLQRSSSVKKGVSEGTVYERGILEAEYSFLCDKILQLKEKARKIQDDIEITEKEITQPTQAEIELKGRLDQLTDRLIQKQSQVETLSAEKAMLLFKIESVSRYLQDGGLSTSSVDVAVDLGASSARIDMEAGSWDPSCKSSAAQFSRIRAAESHLSSIIRQMDVLFSVGVSFLRRNPNARVWAVIYLLLVHIWVIYVFTSHSRPANTGGSGAVYSLENIN